MTAPHMIKVGYRTNRDLTMPWLGRIYRARCECGWQAKKETGIRADARAHGARHMIDAIQGASR